MVGSNTALVSNSRAFVASGKKPQTTIATPTRIRPKQIKNPGGYVMTGAGLTMPGLNPIIIFAMVQKINASAIAEDKEMDMVTLTRVPVGVGEIRPRTIG